jgi:phosphoglycerate dehydrogenase-like enzyme
VSLHVPVLPSTTKMIGRRELSLIRAGATLINTARGAIVDHDALVEQLRTGRFRAYLDTTDPELLPAGHELYVLPNVLLTPHIAGSAGTELHRLGANVVAETKRFVAGEPFAYPEHLGAVSPH